MRSASLCTFLFVIFAALVCVLAGSPHGKVLDKRLSCQQSIDDLSWHCKHLLEELGICLQEIATTGNLLCPTAYQKYAGDFGSCFMDIEDCVFPAGLQWG